MHLYTYMYIYYVFFVLIKILLISKYFIIVWYIKCIIIMQMPMYPPLKFRKFFCIFPFWLETFYKSLLSCNIQYLQYFVCIKLKCTLKNLPQHPVLELGPVDAFESTRVQHRVMSFLCLCLLAPRPLPPRNAVLTFVFILLLLVTYVSSSILATSCCLKTCLKTVI